MTTLYFHAHGAKCNEAGCPRPAVELSFCREHYLERVEQLHSVAERSGKFPRFKLSCFTGDEWREYLAVSYASNKPRAGRPHPCTDCTPTHQRQMEAKGRCDHTEVVFVVTRKGEIQGYIPERSTSDYMRAARGELGKILACPPASLRLEAIKKESQ